MWQREDEDALASWHRLSQFLEVCTMLHIIRLNSLGLLGRIHKRRGVLRAGVKERDWVACIMSSLSGKVVHSAADPTEPFQTLTFLCEQEHHTTAHRLRSEDISCAPLPELVSRMNCLRQRRQHQFLSCPLCFGLLDFRRLTCSTRASASLTATCRIGSMT